MLRDSGLRYKITLTAGLIQAGIIHVYQPCKRERKTRGPEDNVGHKERYLT